MKNELPLHDAVFDGRVLQDKNCNLFFTTSDGRGCEVSLSGVDALQMEDFCGGNIIVFFGTVTGEPPSKNIDLRRLYSPPHPSAPADYHAQYEAFLGRKFGAIASGELYAG